MVMGTTTSASRPQWLWNPTFRRLEQRTSDGQLLAVYVGDGSTTSDLNPSVPRDSWARA